MLPFAPPTVADAMLVRRCVRTGMGSDLAFANIFLLQQKYRTTIAFEGGFFFRHFGGSGRLEGYAFPYGDGDTAKALHLICQDSVERRRPLKFCLLTQEQCHALRDLLPQYGFEFHSDRGDADYIYRRADLADLPGSPYHAKRNHISRFERDCPALHVEPLRTENLQDALAVAHGWLSGSAAETPPALLHESRAIECALHYYRELSLSGCVIYTDSRPIAMSIAGGITPEVAGIHYEKCLPEYRGAYSLINRETARMLSGFAYINREEDLNQPGLRQAKLSYHPALLLQKYTATPSSPC